MKNLFVIILAIVAILTVSCNKKKLPDPVLDLPVQYQWDSSTVSLIDSVSAAPSIVEGNKLLQKSNLGTRILDYLGVKEGKIEYFIVKAGDTVKVLTKKADTLDGVLSKNQLLVRVTPKGGISNMYFVRCMNGMVSPIDGSMFLGEELYILSEGEGPMHHGATYEQVWEMAGRSHLNLTAYRIDKRGFKHRVRNAGTLEDFKKLSAKYGLVRINTLQPGDRLRKNIDNSWDYLGK
ncbi:MAG: hypothetical protein WAZ12_05435 [Candidatus Absconditicoccaceae bacterium]